MEDHCDGHGKGLVLGSQKRTLKWTQESEGFELVACPWVVFARWLLFLLSLPLRLSFFLYISLSISLFSFPLRSNPPIYAWLLHNFACLNKGKQGARGARELQIRACP